MRNIRKKTSWQEVGSWYSKLVGLKGHYYHNQVILPNVLRLMGLKAGESVLDLACGQGVLARRLPGGVEYTGIDSSSRLVDEAKKLSQNRNHIFMVGDIEANLALGKKFDWVTIILAWQNLKHPFRAIRNAALGLKKGGRLLAVINHPCFRIPQNSDWGIDKEKNILYRKINKYMSHLEIPIQSSPFDNENNRVVWSYHYSLSNLCETLADNGLVIETIEEWVSDKKSTGGAAKRENDARREFPMFMAIVARDIDGRR